MPLKPRHHLGSVVDVHVWGESPDEADQAERDARRVAELASWPVASVTRTVGGPASHAHLPPAERVIRRDTQYGRLWVLAWPEH